MAPTAHNSFVPTSSISENFVSRVADNIPRNFHPTVTMLNTEAKRLVRILTRATDGATMLNSTNVEIASTGPDYSSGLAGVNLQLDQELVRYLIASIVAVGLIVAAFRGFHLFSGHIRKVHCLNAEKHQQGYWTYDKNWWQTFTKREIVYAPLGKKRHNREKQLSKAVSYGTLPGRTHFILLLLYVISNVVYCSLLPYGQQDTAKTIAELRGRAGVLATVNMIPLVILAGRNNPLIALLKISFDSYNLFHRWIGRIVILESVIHMLAWYANASAREGSRASFGEIRTDTFLTTGLVAVVCMTIILFQSLSSVRHAFYETFLHGHQLLAFVTFAGVYMHLDIAKLPARPYANMIVIAWIVERLLRTARILWYNVGWRGRTTTKVIIEALPGEACRVTFQLPRACTIRPGSHIYAYLPQFSLWMNHPFSVAWTNPETEPPTGPVLLVDEDDEADKLLGQKHADDIPDRPLSASFPKTPNYLERQSMSVYPHKAKKPLSSLSLICAARTGMTRKIYDAASQAHNKTIFTSGFIEGPYAGHDDLTSYGTVVMFAGGAGITHHLVQIRHLLSCNAASTAATRKIVLAWSVRDLESLTWVAPWMDEILKMQGRREMLTIYLFVTKPKSKQDYMSPSRSIELKNSRCDPGEILDKVLKTPGERCGACFVSVCGPGAFADEVRKATRERMSLGGIDMNEEAFTW